jgi:ATP-dependent RNA helicase RhlE
MYVINFDVPLIYDDYVHRIGRTGRARHTGAAITFADPTERQHMERIAALINQEIPLLPIPEEVATTNTPFVEKQVQDRALDEQRRREDPTFKGAFHEKKEWIKPGVTIDKRTGKPFEEGKHHKKSQKGNKKNPGKKGASSPAMKAVNARPRRRSS